ncbi:MAG: CAP domain-containing protein [Anaerolineae bacterium]|nr:CAP domain-containing protein [Anaerolineae bacterium]
MRRSFLAAAVIIFMAVAWDVPVIHAQNQPSPFTGCKVVPLPLVNAAFEQRVVELTNDHRVSIGLPPLKRAAPLDEAARFHAYDMATEEYFDHDSLDMIERVTEESGTVKTTFNVVCSMAKRVGQSYKGWSRLGENIAAGQESPEQVVQRWLESPGHRANIEGKDFREIGVGFATSGGGFFPTRWVQNFGTRSRIHPLVINREYAQTDSPEVEVYVYGRWTQMRLRNDNGAWTAWQKFQNSFRWRLDWAAGERQVCAELRSGGRREVTCDSIVLTTSDPGLSGAS